MEISIDRLALTVESELGSGGAELAEALASLLGLPCFNEEILAEAASLSGISETLLRRYEERRVLHAYDLTASEVSALRLPPARDFLAAQVAACRALALRGPCVLVEHHSGTALADHRDHISVFVHANRQTRLERFAAREGLRPEQAERLFEKRDRDRRRCFRGVSRHWGEASNYDLTVNSAGVGTEELAHNILRYLETVTREVFIRPTRAQKRGA